MDKQISFARRLRRDQTPAERRFWAVLQPWRDAGWHWRRQAPIGAFVVDFACKRAKVIVEIDGAATIPGPVSRGMNGGRRFWRGRDIVWCGSAMLRCWGTRRGCLRCCVG